MSEFHDPPPEVFEDDERTLIYGEGHSSLLSPQELRDALGIPDDDKIDSYKELSTIGIGGIGAVFSAREPGLNREVALKILRPQYRYQSERIEWFIREARITAQIDHPNIVPVHRMGVFDDVGLYFTMKRVKGETLRSIIRKLAEDRGNYRRRYSMNRLLEIFLGVCNGIAFAHRHGIVHCDLKPGNIMVGRYGEVMVMDWGMAHYRAELDRERSGSKIDLDLDYQLDRRPVPKPDADGKVVFGGTPAFMPPEQFTGEATEANEATDIYGLGTILYSILTWKPSAFDASLPLEELMQAVASGKLAPPRKVAPRGVAVPRELEAICLKAMARKFTQRYENVEEFMQDVRNYIDGYPVAAYSPNFIYSFGKLIQRRPMVPAVLLAAVLTWGGYFGFIHFVDLLQSRSLLNMAEYSYSQAVNYNAMALRVFRNLRDGDELEDYSNIERRNYTPDNVLRYAAEAENAFNSSLEFFSRANEYGRREESVYSTSGNIFKARLNFLLETGQDSKAEALLRQIRVRWKRLFERAMTSDLELIRLVRRIDDRSGVLSVQGTPHNSRTLTIRDAKGKIAKIGSGKIWRSAENLPIGHSAQEFVLPIGDYELEIFVPHQGEIKAPVRIPMAGVSRITLPAGSASLPENLCLVPGGSFMHGKSDASSGNINQATLEPFMISRNEVTFKEYLQFWNSLGYPERKMYMGYYDFDPQSPQPTPIWNLRGELRAPFTGDQPVVGISFDAAEAYCRWLSKKLDRKCRLPSQLEWEKAARGVDMRDYSWGQEYVQNNALLSDYSSRQMFRVGAAPGSFPEDTSPYGAVDMVGNVREMVNERDGAFFTVMGGSYLTPPQMSKCSSSYQVNCGAGDIGFRYVVE